MVDEQDLCNCFVFSSGLRPGEEVVIVIVIVVEHVVDTLHLGRPASMRVQVCVWMDGLTLDTQRALQS